MRNNPLDIFVKEAPDVQKAYSKVIEALSNLNGLDTKTKHLIYIAMKVITDDKLAIKYHVPMAKSAGATRQEIRDSVLLSISVCGLKGISQILPMALEEYDNK
ncbi:carboxymuconolactone decarboxylase family protein [uncultured Draconibacterium sp.]|uniref:carboxymuconolactone decarboxylase family protein n=1 Tax=uncultured Draconibacterium sp. TaxID=1573823 RepID=UPI0029C03E52|nr:carboxymuconolactone decarboxylase family protein [uncultured Draconibacterium sp.]